MNEKLEESVERLQDEMNNKSNAFILRDVKSLKTFGYSASQMKMAGFSVNELLSAWSIDELKAEGLAFSPSLILAIKYGSCSIGGSGKSVTATGDGHHCITSIDPLSREFVSVFKIKVNKMNGGINLGLIGNVNPRKYSYSDTTSYIWVSGGAYIGGTYHKGFGGWNGFKEDDEVFSMFEPEIKKLTMKVKRLGKNRSFELQCDKIDEAYIYIDFYYSGDQVTLDEMKAEEQFDYVGS